MERQTGEPRPPRRPFEGLRDRLRPARDGLPARIREAIEPLPDIDDPAFAEAFDRYADCRVVLLGEASHGTYEFYRARAAITKRLVERHGFGIVAVEADWPDAAHIDRYVRHRPKREGENASEQDAPFQRFPTWMWRNTDVDAFVCWLRSHNAKLGPDAMTGFYGLDLYNLGGSITPLTMATNSSTLPPTPGSSRMPRPITG